MQGGVAQSEQVAVRGGVNEQGWEVLMTYFLCKPTVKQGSIGVGA